MSYSFDQMKDKLIDLTEFEKILAPTDGLSEISFPMDGSSLPVTVDLPSGWNVGIKDAPGELLTEATIKIGGNEFQLTKDAILEATSKIGLTKDYVSRTPGPLVAEHVNYWMKNTGEKGMKLLAKDDRGLAFTNPGISPFSNKRLLEEAVDAIQDFWPVGSQPPTPMVDYKYANSLTKTSFRLVMPAVAKTLKTSRDQDDWSVGLDVRNSITGDRPLSVNGYLFAWVCTNGMTSTHAASGKYNRKSGQGETAYEWFREAAGAALGDLEHELDAVEALAAVDVSGELNNVMNDIFDTYKVPMPAREAVIAEFIENDDPTMFGVHAAITAAANDGELDEKVVSRLLEIGGDLPATVVQRCSSCKRLPVG